MPNNELEDYVDEYCNDYSNVEYDEEQQWINENN